MAADDGLLFCAVPGCGAEATHDSPADLCEDHWTNWFRADSDDGDEVLERLLAGEPVAMDPRWDD